MKVRVMKNIEIVYWKKLIATLNSVSIATLINKMNKESDEHDFIELNCFSLDKIRDFTVMRCGGMSTNKSEKGQVQTYVSVWKTTIFQLI